MNRHFRPTNVNMAICIAFSAVAGNAMAAEPYPALPPALSISVAPNIIFFLDTSGSMLQDADNAWMHLGLCDSIANWSGCVNNNTNDYRTTVDSEALTPNSKMNIAKRVTRSVVQKLIDDNLIPDPNNSAVKIKKGQVRVGLFSFHDKPTSVGGAERGEASILRAEVKDVSVKANQDALVASINALNGRTATPLGEGLLEITRYLQGSTSLYSKPYPGVATSYASPIEYRCQKNFAIVLTDGASTNDDNFPASGVDYTARDSAGAAVAKTFKICTGSDSVADNDLDVNCPASLEGSLATPGFGTGTDRFRSLRDVAKYARVADLRVGGNDSDGKSFDAPEFNKQNLVTYTVGFTVDNDVLPGAAIASGGKYFKATNEASLTTALNNAVSSIVASTSNAGGIATQSQYTSTSNKIFQPVFNPNGWYGELRCLDFSTKLPCTPNAKESIPAADSRKIYSSKVVGATTTPFAFNDAAGLTAMTDAQKTALATTPELLMSTSDAAEIATRKATALAATADQKNTINFLRGTEGITGFRTRPLVGGVKTFLGDIVDSQPVVVAVPSGFTNATDYADFKTLAASRGMVLVGANDGMLHAFQTSDMTELGAYIPSSVYPHLRALTASDYGTSGGTPHTYHVNGSIGTPMDFKTSTSGAWKTIVVGGLGQGGQGYYALDVTKAASFNAATDLVKWEWTDASDASIGYSFGMPIMSTVRQSTSASVPAVIFSNGYQNSYDDTVSGGQKTSSNTSALYIVNADTGVLIKKLELPTTGTYKSEGLSSPWGLDVASDGILDYVYAGDVKGNLWRFDLTSDSAAGFKVSTNGTDAVPLFKTPAGQPITMRPATTGVQNRGNMVLFGTGQLLTDADRSTTTTQAFYGILDKMQSTITTMTITSDLVEQTVVQEFAVTTGTNKQGTFRKVSGNEIDVKDAASTKNGWYMNLPNSSERLVGTPRIYSTVVAFPTGVPISSEMCVPGGTGWVMALNPLTGSIVSRNNDKPSLNKDYSYFDMNGDGKSTTTDKVLFTTGGSAYASGIKVANGIPTELSFVSNSVNLTSLTGLVGADPYSGTGGFVAMLEANAQGVAAGPADKGGGTKSVPIQRPDPKGGGDQCYGALGNANVICEKTNPPPTAGVKVESSTWRELKN